MIFTKIQPMLDTIIAHPFNRELAQGTLPYQTFEFYLHQDQLYLADYSRALAITAARIEHIPHMQQFCQFALDAVQSERDMQTKLLTGTINIPTEQSPECFMYTNYLLQCASIAPVEQAVASLLPCFYVYAKVGEALSPFNYSNHPYHDWISLYSSEEFYLSVQQAVEIYHYLSQQASTQLQQKMHTAFIKSTQLEWLFWQSAYHKNQWPDLPLNELTSLFKQF